MPTRTPQHEGSRYALFFPSLRLMQVFVLHADDVDVTRVYDLMFSMVVSASTAARHSPRFLLPFSSHCANFKVYCQPRTRLSLSFRPLWRSLQNLGQRDAQTFGACNTNAPRKNRRSVLMLGSVFRASPGSTIRVWFYIAQSGPMAAPGQHGKCCQASWNDHGIFGHNADTR